MSTLNASFSVPFQYPVVFTENLFQSFDKHLVDQLGYSNRHVLPVIEESLIAAHPNLIKDIEAYFDRFEFRQNPALILPGGEQCKNQPLLVEKIIQRSIDLQIDRHAYIMAIGGGAFLDMVGYAAAISHRGIRLIRFPTTVLAQNDAGVGVKNAINFQGRKNFIGTFTPPFAVINDYQFITTLAEKDKRAGIAEAIKVALIKDSEFFDDLFNNQKALAAFETQAMKDMIVRCAKSHLDHICHNGDPFELGSARPLDFGHWSAHSLEEESNFSLRHGEAVAIGILIDSTYSLKKSWINQDSYQKIKSLFIALGFEIKHAALSNLKVEQALDNFRTHLGGELCITMLKGIGSCHEVHEIDCELMQNCIQELLA